MRKSAPTAFTTSLVALMLAGVLASPAAADFQVRGRFLYQDRVFGPAGFTGSDVNLPIRLADVEVRDFNNSLVVLGTGATDLNGTFTINCVDNQIRDVYVRVLTKADQTPSFKARVLNNPTSNAVYALVTPPYPAHTPTVDIDFTASPVVATQSPSSTTIGEPFNIFDQALDAFDFIASLTGSRPTRLMTLFWYKGSLDGTYYSHGDASIHLLGGGSDSDGYDDTVILHEIGHYTEYNLANSNNPGGAHSLSGYYALTLTWSEGWATFFENMVRNWKGFGRPDLYVDTNGTTGTGGAFISYSVENPVYGQPGANNEITVNALLWDIVDTPAVADLTPGTDDDALNLANGPADFWDVFVNYIRTATSISLEDFWDGWFARGHDEQAAMQALFAARGVEYFPDAFESDATPILAKTVVAGSAATHRTTYPAGDEDWFVIGVQAASQYVFATQNLLSGADTWLDLYAADGTTPIQSNDDVSPPGDVSSRITYTPGTSAVLYLRCKRKTDQHTYGSYDLLVTGAPVPVELTDVQVAGVPGGIQLRWHARRDGAFSHFEVERGPAAAGPWTVLASVDPTTSDGTMEVYEYLDRAAEPGSRYAYRIVGVESTGERTAFGPFGLDVVVPARFALESPRPNPFNPTTTVAFELPRTTRAFLRIYAADGRLIRTLIDGENLVAGPHEIRWDGRSDNGSGVASGVYWFRLLADGEHQVRRGVLVR
jgi:FlgD Ig-like domain